MRGEGERREGGVQGEKEKRRREGGVQGEKGWSRANFDPWCVV